MKVIHPEVEPPIVVTLLLPYPPSRDPTAEEGVFPEQVPCDDCWRLHAGEVGEGIGHCRQQVRRRRHLERSSSNPEKARCPQVKVPIEGAKTYDGQPLDFKRDILPNFPKSSIRNVIRAYLSLSSPFQNYVAPSHFFQDLKDFYPKKFNAAAAYFVKNVL